MKRYLFILFICLYPINNAMAIDSPWQQKLPFKNATITYTISGTMQGSKTLYVTDHGKTIAEYRQTSMAMFGMTQNQNEVIITTPEWVYTIDMLTRSGHKQTNPEKFMIAEFNKLSKSDQKKLVKNANKLGLSAIDGMQGTVEKKATKILGYTCDKVSIMGSTIYTIKDTNLALKVQSNIMGVTIKEEASSVKKGKVPTDKFKVPAGIQLTQDSQEEEMMQMQAANVVANLVAGKAPVPAGGGYGQRNQDGSHPADQPSPEQMEQMHEMMKMFGNQGK